MVKTLINFINFLDGSICLIFGYSLIRLYAFISFFLKNAKASFKPNNLGI